MDRIISNIVNNAIHALEEVDNQEKSIQIAAAIDNESLIISVKDNGSGMSSKTMNHIFEPLYSTKTFGVGLGMSIVKNAVEKLNGTINIESNEGVGTSVRVTIPVEV